MTSFPECYACRHERRFADLPPRERIAADDSWRVAHAFGTALPGWLILLPRRHVTSVAELTGAESAGLGNWQVSLSRAVQAVTGCAKTYIVAFGEAEGFEHLHFHVIPRAHDLAVPLRGPGVFGLLGRSQTDSVPEADLDQIALRVREHLGDGVV
jgi:diadenosine tetraphosphate (Ap4A) HIT family hydrolase